MSRSPPLIAIAAVDPVGVIGKNGALPWHCPEDLTHFRSATLGKTLIMGYKTFRSLPASLFQGRKSVILTRNHSIDPEIGIPMRNFEEWVSHREQEQDRTEIQFVIGGGEIFLLFFEERQITNGLITHLKHRYEGDVFFPLSHLKGRPKKLIRETDEFSIIQYGRISSLLDLQEEIPDLQYEHFDPLRKKRIDRREKWLLHREAAARLLRVKKRVEPMGLHPKIWKGYEPLETQTASGGAPPDSRDREERDRHSRGTAVDLTLADQDNREIQMPPRFDDRSEPGVFETERENRNLLQKVMEENGFTPRPSEWWHFDLKGWEEYPPIENPFDNIYPFEFNGIQKGNV